MNRTQQQIDNAFKYHKPVGRDVAKLETIRDDAREFAFKLESLCPESRELSLALTKLEETVMWANAAIVRSENE